MIPKDPFMLLSFVNMKLRDENRSLDDFCAAYQVSREEIEEKLNGIGYTYEKETNSFR